MTPGNDNIVHVSNIAPVEFPMAAVVVLGSINNNLGNNYGYTGYGQQYNSNNNRFNNNRNNYGAGRYNSQYGNNNGYYNQYNNNNRYGNRYGNNNYYGSSTRS